MPIAFRKRCRKNHTPSGKNPGKGAHQRMTTLCCEIHTGRCIYLTTGATIASVYFGEGWGLGGQRSGFPVSVLIEHFVEEHTGGYGEIERVASADHRNSDDGVADASACGRKALLLGT